MNKYPFLLNNKNIMDFNQPLISSENSQLSRSSVDQQIEQNEKEQPMKYIPAQQSVIEQNEKEQPMKYTPVQQPVIEQNVIVENNGKKEGFVSKLKKSIKRRFISLLFSITVCIVIYNVISIIIKNKSIGKKLNSAGEVCDSVKYVIITYVNFAIFGFTMLCVLPPNIHKLYDYYQELKKE
jgi:hypothetical protein